jgi:hypothetical protein
MPQFLFSVITARSATLFCTIPTRGILREMLQLLRSTLAYYASGNLPS